MLKDCLDMETIVSPNHVGSGKVSVADALWSLIAGQTKSTRRALAEKLLSDDIELAEQLVLKASIERGWQQVKAMQAAGSNNGSLQDLIDELNGGRDESKLACSFEPKRSGRSQMRKA